MIVLVPSADSLVHEPGGNERIRIDNIAAIDNDRVIAATEPLYLAYI